jgi:hypothetical protein
MPYLPWAVVTSLAPGAYGVINNFNAFSPAQPQQQDILNFLCSL